MSKPRAVLITSGGMDSATLAYHYAAEGYDLHMVGFDYGQRHRKELSALANVGSKLNAKVSVVDLTTLKQHLRGSSLTSEDVNVPDGHYAEETMRITVVPNRNAIMLSVATGIAVAEKAEVVATGVHAGDHFIYPDCRPGFFEPFAKAMIEGNEGMGAPGLHLEAPFIAMTKAQIAALGASLGVDYALTWSCYKGGEIHCGRCGTCVERIEAFLLAKVDDPTKYEETAFALAEIERKS